MFFSLLLNKKKRDTVSKFSITPFFMSVNIKRTMLNSFFFIVTIYSDLIYTVFVTSMGITSVFS